LVIAGACASLTALTDLRGEMATAGPPADEDQQVAVQLLELPEKERIISERESRGLKLELERERQVTGELQRQLANANLGWAQSTSLARQNSEANAELKAMRDKVASLQNAVETERMKKEALEQQKRLAEQHSHSLEEQNAEHENAGRATSQEIAQLKETKRQLQSKVQEAERLCALVLALTATKQSMRFKER
jgi:chromosome segregation ATPase